MGTSDNWLKAKFRVEFQRAAESARFFERLIRKEGKNGRAELRRLAEKVGAVLPLDGENPHPALPRAQSLSGEGKRGETPVPLGSGGSGTRRRKGMRLRSTVETPVSLGGSGRRTQRRSGFHGIRGIRSDGTMHAGVAGSH